MNKEKQMRELVPLIYDKLCKIDSIYHNLSPDKMLASTQAYNVAEMITDLNYRKESEVAEEIIKMIERSQIGTCNLGGEFIIIPACIVCGIEEVFAERSNNEHREAN